MTNPFTALIPYAHVASVPVSVAFYAKLGFEANTHTPDGEPEPTWAWLDNGRGAVLMVEKASAPVIADEQAVFFTLYCDDVEAKHAELAALGLEVGPITRPFYSPRGTFRTHDPDGYGLTITHT